MRTFYSPLRRAHLARVGPGYGYKFAGGRITVSDEAAPELAAYAAAHPELRIVELLPEPPPAPATSPAPAAIRLRDRRIRATDALELEATAADELVPDVPSAEASALEAPDTSEDAP